MSQKSYDVAIVGGGVVGNSIARELSRYKLRIVLFEKETEVAFGVSKSNSGIIHPGTQNPPDSLKGKLCVLGNKLIRKVSKELGVDFKEVGSLIVTFSSDGIPKLKRIKKEAEMLGVRGLKIVDKNWLKIHEPNLSDEIVCALYAPTAGIISPYRLVYDLAENARRNGVEYYAEAEVQDIKRIPDNEFELNTKKGLFKARYVINAAGLYADDVSKMVGVDDFKITPRKGEEFLLDKKRQYLTNHIIFPLPTKTSKGVLVIKTSDGNPMIGPTAEDIDDKEDLSTSDRGLNAALQSVQKMVPSIDGNDIIAYFAGLRPASGHDFIIRGEKKVPGFINIAGIQSPGLTAAPAIALMVCDILKKSGLSLRKKALFHGHRHMEVHLFNIPLSKTRKLIKKDPAYGDIVCRCEMVSAGEIREAIRRGATTLDGIKFRTRAQSGRCHGGFCTTRIMKILAEETGKPLTEITKRGNGSELAKKDRNDA